MLLEKWHCKRIGRLPLFMHLTPDDVYSLFRETQYRLTLFEKGTTVAHQGASCHAMMFLIDGKLVASMTDHNNKKVIIEYLDSPQIIAPAFLFSSEAKYPVDVETMLESCVLFLPKKEVLNFFLNDSQMMSSILALISNRTQFLSKRLLYLSCKTIEEKVILFIRDEYVSQQKRELTLSVSVTDLSELLAVTRPALTRVLTQLQKRNLIFRNRRSLFIEDLSFFGLNNNSLD